MLLLLGFVDFVAGVAVELDVVVVLVAAGVVAELVVVFAAAGVVVVVLRHVEKFISLLCKLLLQQSVLVTGETIQNGLSHFTSKRASPSHKSL